MTTGITAVPKQKNDSPATRDNMTWTLTKACRVGETYALARHDVRVVRIIEERPDCNLCAVEVVGPINGAAPLAFDGKFQREDFRS